MKTRLLAGLKVMAFAVVLLSGGSLLGAQISIRIGPPPPPRVVHVRPPVPGPDYVWVEGYWYPVGNHYRWHEGYWTRAPYSGAYWVGPRYEGGTFYNGYWEGGRGRIEHEHRWDRERNRDYREHEEHERHEREEHH
jgi:hypothetical protein